MEYPEKETLAQGFAYARPDGTVADPDGAVWPSKRAWLVYKGVANPDDLTDLPQAWLNYIVKHGVPLADGIIEIAPGVLWVTVRD